MKMNYQKERNHLAGFEITHDNKIMSYRLYEDENEKYILKIFDIETKEELDHTILELLYCDYFWYKNEFIFYTLGDDANRI